MTKAEALQATVARREADFATETHQVSLLHSRIESLDSDNVRLARGEAAAESRAKVALVKLTAAEGAAQEEMNAIADEAEAMFLLRDEAHAAAEDRLSNFESKHEDHLAAHAELNALHDALKEQLGKMDPKQVALKDAIEFLESCRTSVYVTGA